MQRIVVPGEKIHDTQIRIDNTITDRNGTYSCILGYFDDERKVLTPLEGLWNPRPGDTVIGVVEEDRGTTLTINLNAPYKGLALTKFLEAEISANDIIVANVKVLEKGGTIVLLKPTPLRGGKLMSIKPSRIPRIIGKNSTMIKQITDATATSVIIGLNGLIWMKGGDIDLATQAILKVGEEAHTTGLTERIKTMLEQGRNNKVQ
jgi:exosome complex component RRP4